MILTKAQILDADDIGKETIPVPEWGGEVLVRMLTGAQRDAFEDSIIKVRGKSKETNLVNIRARLCALCIIDEEGKRLFNDTEIVNLGNKSAIALDRVFSAARKLNGLTEDDVEELAKNLDKGQSEDSTTV